MATQHEIHPPNTHDLASIIVPLCGIGEEILPLIQRSEAAEKTREFLLLLATAKMSVERAVDALRRAAELIE